MLPQLLSRRDREFPCARGFQSHNSAPSRIVDKQRRRLGRIRRHIMRVLNMPMPQGSQYASLRAKAAILLFTLCCLLSTIRILREAPNPAHLNPDEISRRSDQRFGAVKTRLPAIGVIGYIGESGNSSTPDYYLTQYALAPLVVDRSTHHAIVVGNFPLSPPSDLPRNLRLVEDFGSGVLLFAGEDAR
jgi:hypothetical protein